MMKNEQQWVQIGPASIHYQVVGAGNPLVLVHGLAGSTRWWAKNINPLAEKFQVYMVDLVGFGQSRSPRGFVLSEAALYLKMWMDRLNLTQASILGHSMGGGIVASLAADFPERVERLVLVDAVGIPFGRSFARQALGTALWLRHAPLDLLGVIVTDTYRFGLIRTLQIGRDLLTHDLRPKLVQIAAPVLVVWGERDTVVPLALGKKLNSCLDNSRLVTIQGAGHVPMWEKSAEFNEALLNFLALPRPYPLSQLT